VQVRGQRWYCACVYAEAGKVLGPLRKEESAAAADLQQINAVVRRQREFTSSINRSGMEHAAELTKHKQLHEITCPDVLGHPEQPKQDNWSPQRLRQSGGERQPSIANSPGQCKRKLHLISGDHDFG